MSEPTVFYPAEPNLQSYIDWGRKKRSRQVSISLEHGGNGHPYLYVWCYDTVLGVGQRCVWEIDGGKVIPASEIDLRAEREAVGV